MIIAAVHVATKHIDLNEESSPRFSGVSGACGPGAVSSTTVKVLTES